MGEEKIWVHPVVPRDEAMKSNRKKTGRSGRKDYRISPYTGLTRESWLEACREEEGLGQVLVLGRILWCAVPAGALSGAPGRSNLYLP